MPFEDINTICRDCGARFTVSAGEQEWLSRRELNPNVTRCKPCRAQRRALAHGSAVDGPRDPRTWR